MPVSSHEDAVARHDLTDALTRSLPAAEASAVTAPQRVRIDAAWTPSTTGKPSFAGVDLQAGASASGMVAGASYRVVGVLVPASPGRRAKLWPRSIEALTEGRLVDLPGLRLHSYRAEPIDTTETVGLETWQSPPRTATTDVLVGTRGRTTYIAIVQVLDPRHILDVHLHARRAWRRWFAQPGPPSLFCVLEPDDLGRQDSLGGTIAPFIASPSLAADTVALRGRLRDAVNGTRHSIGFGVTIVAIAGSEIALLCTSDHRVVRRRDEAEQSFNFWRDEFLSGFVASAVEAGLPEEDALQALPANLYGEQVSPVTMSLAPGDQWEIEGPREVAGKDRDHHQVAVTIDVLTTGG